MKKDYYEILGISKDATEDEIKSAYRKLAKKYHPDVSKEANPEEKFNEIGEAYEVLSDQQKRANYDRYGSATGPNMGDPFGGSYSYSSSFEDVDLSDIFSSFFGGSFFQNDRPRKGSDNLIKIKITWDEAIFGTKKDLNIDIFDENNQRRNDKIKITIPAGVSTSDRLRVPNKGGPGQNGGPNGDLYIDFVIESHPFYDRDGDDIYLEVPITISEALLGFKKAIPTIHGNVTLSVSGGVQSGDRQRLKNKGVHNHSGSKGDMFVIFKVLIPEKLTMEQKKLIKSLSKTKFNHKEIEELNKFTKAN